jgi:uncharacterized membrane protein YoaK (UPF0700 family)
MDPEDQPAQPAKPRGNAVSRHMTRKIHPFLSSIPILLCCFTSGVVDSSVFNAWGIFASMQTGNTVILGLGASSNPPGHPRSWLLALDAILFFFLGAFATAQATKIGFTAYKRHTLVVSFFLQAILVTIAAALVQSSVVPGLHPDGSESFIELVPLAMLAFQAGQQCVAARQLGLNEIPTTVLTSVYCDLGNDPELFVDLNENWKRNRRFAAVVLLLSGAIIGGWLSRTDEGMAAGLWMVAGIKFGITIAWLFWGVQSEKEPEEK